MKSKQLREKVFALKKELIRNIRSEFTKTNFEKIEFTWNLNSLDLVFPDTDFGEDIFSISKNGAKFEQGEFKAWNKFYNLTDLVDILEYLEGYNSFLNSSEGPVSWDVASSHFFDAREVNDPERYLWSAKIDAYGNQIYCPTNKIKVLKSEKSS